MLPSDWQAERPQLLPGHNPKRAWPNLQWNFGFCLQRVVLVSHDVGPVLLFQNVWKVSLFSCRAWPFHRFLWLLLSVSSYRSPLQMWFSVKHGKLNRAVVDRCSSNVQPVKLFQFLSTTCSDLHSNNFQILFLPNWISVVWIVNLIWRVWTERNWMFSACSGKHYADQLLILIFWKTNIFGNIIQGKRPATELYRKFTQLWKNRTLM